MDRFGQPRFLPMARSMLLAAKTVRSNCGKRAESRMAYGNERLTLNSESSTQTKSSCKDIGLGTPRQGG